MAKDASAVSLWVYGICLVVHFVFATAGGCSPDKDRFKTAIRSSGLTEPTKHGYDFFECGYGDIWVEGFTAHQIQLSKSAEVTDVTVNGTMCCGIFKGCTIRWP